jgi:hypothetical protein
MNLGSDRPLDLLRPKGRCRIDARGAGALAACNVLGPWSVYIIEHLELPTSKATVSRASKGAHALLAERAGLNVTPPTFLGIAAAKAKTGMK